MQCTILKNGKKEEFEWIDKIWYKFILGVFLVFATDEHRLSQIEYK
jgi:hypothetical protein